MNAENVRNTDIGQYFYFLMCRELNISVEFDNDQLNDVEQSEIIRKAALMCSNTYWTFEHGAARYMDYLYPSCLGFYDSFYDYDSSGDSGNWVDSVGLMNQKKFLITRPAVLDENEKAVEDLYAELNSKDIQHTSDSKENYELDESDSENAEDKVPSVVPEIRQEKKERSIRDVDYNIAFFSFETEFLGLQNDSGKKVLVRGDDKNMYRIYYDEKLRVSKKETWKISSGLAGSELVTSHLYTYGDSDLPVLCVLTGKDYRHEMKYNDKGLVIESKNYVLTDKGDYIASLSKWRFGDDGKILEKETVEYNYKKGSIKKIISTESRKEEYQYKVDDKNPDYFYYENNQLRLKKLYSSKDDYVVSTYFDSGFVVESYYKDSTRVKEIFYLDGKIKRIKKYAD